MKINCQYNVSRMRLSLHVESLSNSRSRSQSIDDGYPIYRDRTVDQNMTVSRYIPKMCKYDISGNRKGVLVNELLNSHNRHRCCLLISCFVYRSYKSTQPSLRQ